MATAAITQVGSLLLATYESPSTVVAANPHQENATSRSKSPHHGWRSRALGLRVQKDLSEDACRLWTIILGLLGYIGCIQALCKG